jgi:hypothetical protein
MFEATRVMESKTSSPVQALNVSNRTEFHRMLLLLLLEQPLGLDKRLLVHDLNRPQRGHPHLPPPNYSYLSPYLFGLSQRPFVRFQQGRLLLVAFCWEMDIQIGS